MTDVHQYNGTKASEVIEPRHVERVPTKLELDRLDRPEVRRGWLAWHRLAWWLELAMVAACYLIYETSRTFASSQRAPAVAHGRQVFQAEQWLHLDPEVALNRWLNHFDIVSDMAGYYYSTLHFVVTPLVLIYLYSRRADAYARLRSALVLTTAAGLVVFLLWPVAPPRFTVPGLTDTLLQHHVMGMSNGHGVSGLINEYAAMPSLHVAWALWCAAAIVLTHRSRWRHLAWLYPMTTTFVVLATANHYLLDAVGGALVVFASLAVVYAPRRTNARRHWTVDDLSKVAP